MSFELSDLMLAIFRSVIAMSNSMSPASTILRRNKQVGKPRECLQDPILVIACILGWQLLELVYGHVEHPVTKTCGRLTTQGGASTDVILEGVRFWLGERPLIA